MLLHMCFCLKQKRWKQNRHFFNYWQRKPLLFFTRKCFLDQFHWTNVDVFWKLKVNGKQLICFNKETVSCIWHLGSSHFGGIEACNVMMWMIKCLPPNSPPHPRATFVAVVPEKWSKGGLVFDLIVFAREILFGDHVYFFKKKKLHLCI